MAENIQIKITGDSSSAVRSFGAIGESLIIANQGLSLFSSIIGGLAEPLGKVVDIGADFSGQMAAIKSISNLTADEFTGLSEKAKEIGKTTAFTGKEAGQGMEALIKAGLSADQVLDSIGTTMDLSSASGLNLSDAANLVAIQMKIFEESGLSAEDTVNLLAKTANSSAQDIFHLQESLKTASPIANAFGISFEDLTVILGAMADTGIRGEMAGTALRGALNALANPTDQVAKKLNTLGLSVSDVNPLTNDFGSILDKVKDSGADAKDILQILGTEAGGKLPKLFMKGSSTLSDFKKKQDESNDAATTASQKLDNLNGDFTKFKSAASGLANTLFEEAEPALRGVTQTATGVVSSLSDAVEGEGRKPGFTGFLESIGLINNQAALDELSGGLKSTDSLREEYDQSFKDWNDVFGVLTDQSGVSIDAPTVSFDAPEIGVFQDTTKEVSKIKTEGELIDDKLKEISKKYDGQILQLSDQELGLMSLKEKQDLYQGAIDAQPYMDQLFEIDAQETSLALLKEKQEDALAAAEADPYIEQLKILKEQEDSLDALKKKQKEALGIASQKKPSELLTSALGAVGGTITGVGAGVATGVAKGAGLGGFISGFQTGGFQGALVQGITDLVLSNEGMGEAIGALNQVVGEIFAPVAEALVPVVQALLPLLEVLKPMFEVVGRVLSIIVKSFMPVFEALLPLFEIISDAFVALEPALSIVAEVIGDILAATLVPLLEALQPLFEEFIPILKDLGPLFELLKPFFHIFGQIVGVMVDSLIPAIKLLTFAVDIVGSIFHEVVKEATNFVKEIEGIGDKITEFGQWISDLFGKALDLAKFLRDKIGAAFTHAIGQLGGGFKSLFTRVKEAFTKAVGSVSGRFKGLWDRITSALNSAIGGVSGRFQNLWNQITTAIQDALGFKNFSFNDLWNRITTALQDAVGFKNFSFSTLWGRISSAFSSAIGNLGGNFTSFWDNLKNSMTKALFGDQQTVNFTSFWNQLKDAMDKAIGQLGGSSSGAGGIKLNLDQFGFATGGLVTPGRMMRLPGMDHDAGLIMAHKGERVLTKSEVMGEENRFNNSNNNSSNVTLNFNVNSVSPRENVEEIRQLIEELSLTGRLRLS